MSDFALPVPEHALVQHDHVQQMLELQDHGGKGKDKGGKDKHDGRSNGKGSSSNNSHEWPVCYDDRGSKGFKDGKGVGGQSPYGLPKGKGRNESKGKDKGNRKSKAEVCLVWDDVWGPVV